MGLSYSTKGTSLGEKEIREPRLPHLVDAVGVADLLGCGKTWQEAGQKEWSAKMMS